MICASCAISTTSLFGIYLGWQHVDGVQDSRWCWLIDLYFRYGSCDSDLNRKFGQLILWGAGPALHQHQWRQLSGSSRCVCVCVHFVDLALLLCPLNKALLGTRCFIGFVIEKLDLHVCYWCLKLCCCLKLSWLVWAILFISTAVERQTMQVSVGLHGCTICHFWFLLFCTAARNKPEADWLQGA